MHDAPRKDSSELIAELQGLGVAVKMLTGDAFPIAEEVAHSVGLGQVRRADELRSALSENATSAARIIESCGGFAEVLPEGMSYGVHIHVETDKEEISVHLGPAWYLENQDVKIAPKDKVEVKGSRITFGGKPAIIASEMRKGDEVLKLRDDNGFPVWSGWRRR